MASYELTRHLKTNSVTSHIAEYCSLGSQSMKAANRQATGSEEECDRVSTN